MYQDKITGAFHFEGMEDEDALRFAWTCLMDLSWRGEIEVIWRIIFKKPPKCAGYKPPEYYKKKSYEELCRMAKGMRE